MRNYALTYGSAVRQRTNRQETTMARHGTMPEMIYQRQLQISAEKVNLASSVVSEVTESEEGVDKLTASPRMSMWRLQSMIQVLTKMRKWKVEAQTF